MKNTSPSLLKSLVSEGLRSNQKPKIIKPDVSRFTIDLSKNIIICNKCHATNPFPSDIQLQYKKQSIITAFKATHQNCE